MCVWQAPLVQLCYRSIKDDLRFNQSFETETPLCVWQAPLIGFLTVTIRSFFKFYWILYCDVMLMMGSQNHGRLIFSLQV